MKIVIGIIAIAVFVLIPAFVVTLLYAGFLLLFPALVIYILYQTLDKLIQQKTLSRLLFFTIISLPLIWISRGYYEYATACDAAHPVVLNQATRPKSLQIKLGAISDIDFGGFRSLNNFSLQDFVQDGIFEVIETSEDYIFDGIKKQRYTQHRKEGRGVTSDLIISEYALEIQAKSIGHFYFPLYEVTYEIKNIKTNKRLGIAKDVLFGGGYLGTYMRLLGGDQDAEFHSCGYADHNPSGYWRPSRTSDKRFQQYINADVKFVLSVFENTDKKWTDLEPVKTTAELAAGAANAARDAMDAANAAVEATRSPK